jgi:cell division protein ZipA
LGELRLILIGIGLVLLAAIWWWSARGSRQARGAMELRDAPVPDHASALAKPAPARADSDRRNEPQVREWGVPPLEPLTIKPADFDRVPVLDMPMMVDVATVDSEALDIEDLDIDFSDDPVPEAHRTMPEPDFAAGLTPPSSARTPTPPPSPVRMPTTAPPARAASTAATAPVNADPSDRFAPAAPPKPNVSELQKIVSLRVCALGEDRWPGEQLMSALEAEGLAYGKYQVFHRKHADGRSLFCVASLVEPGTFDSARMSEQEFRGVALFAVLPGPAEPIQTVDALIATAQGLAANLTGMVQDGKGVPLSPSRAAALREDVARFQAQIA